MKRHILKTQMRKTTSKTPFIKDHTGLERSAACIIRIIEKNKSLTIINVR